MGARIYTTVPVDVRDGSPVAPAQNSATGHATFYTGGEQVEVRDIPASSPGLITLSQIPNTKIRAVAPAQPGSEYWGSVTAITAGWNGGCLGEDPVDGTPTLYQACPGGHADYWPSCVFSVRVEENSPGWVNRTPDLPAYTTQTLSQYTMPNGDIRPSSRHTYQGQQWLPQMKKIWMCSGSPWMSGFPDNAVFLFNPSTNKFERKTDAPFASAGLTSVVVPNGNVVYTVNASQHVYEYDPVADTHTRLGPSSSNPYFGDGGSHAVMVFTGTELWLFNHDGLAGNEVLVAAYGPTVEWTKRTIAGLQYRMYPGLEWDPVMQRIVHWQGDLQLIDPATNTSEFIPGTIVPTSNGTFGRFRRLPNGQYVLHNWVDEDIYILNIAPTQPEPEPEPEPAPFFEGKYRYQADQLFQPASTVEGIPSPTAACASSKYVGNGWSWDDQVNGDWRDADGVRYGSNPLASGPINSSAGPEHSFDFRAALEAGKSKWNAFLLRTSSPQFRVVSGGYATNPPRVDVTYTDSTAETLECLFSTPVSPDTAQALAYNQQLPIFVEFRRPNPDKTIATATLHVHVVGYYGGDTMLEAMLADPPVNVDPVEQGIAATVGLLDDGIESHPGIIGAQRYVDGTAFGDFACQDPRSIIHNYSGRAGFSPHLWDSTQAPDTNLLPYVDTGKWVNWGFNWVLKSSSDLEAEGVAPLAPGLGALRVTMPNEAPGPGEVFERRGTTGANGMIFLPEPLFGLLKKIHVRYYVYVAPYSVADKQYQILQDIGGGVMQSAWLGHAGKCFITPHHGTSFGSNSSTAGGPRGWALRFAYNDPLAPVGPEIGGMYFGLHQDLAGNNPINYEGLDSQHPENVSFGQRGGLGQTLYHGRWYCVEMMYDLNSVMMEAPGYLPDGAIKVWVDGRLALTREDFVFRNLPLLAVSPTHPDRPPVREIGHIGLWWDWYNGGMTPNAVDRAHYMTGLAYGFDYIGPMRLA